MSKIIAFLFFFILPFSVFSQQVLIRGEAISFDNQHFAQAKNKHDGNLTHFFRYAHFTQIPTEGEKARLTASGIQFLSYIAERTYLVALTQPISKDFCERFGMDALIPIKMETKLSQKVKERPIPDFAQAENGLVKIIVKGYQTINPSDFKQLFLKKMIQVDLASQYNAYVEVLVSEEHIVDIMAWPEVSFIDWINPKGEPEDHVGRAIHRANILDANYAGGRHYDGAGVKVLVRDDGSIGPHIDFQGRVNQADPLLFGGSDHGDMVAGIVAGAGNIEPTFKGMAVGASLYVRDYTSSFEDYTLGLHLSDNVVVTTTSYSQGCNVGYTASMETVDQQIYEYPTLMHVFSAGNKGVSNCDYGAGEGWGNITGGHKQGKNVIATGNLLANTVLVNSSSRGPAYDGRIKPDLCAHGNFQMSADPDNEYGPGGGTSAASPGVAGVFVQLIQAYKELNGGLEPNSALIKACLLNSAIDLGNPGPDFKYGWGELNGFRALKILENNHYLMDTITHGQSDNHTIHIDADQSQVRFMLYWADPPASSGASKALINNLDLKVISPSGDTILPWVLDHSPDPVKLDLPAVHGIDNLNNVEQVSFQAPLAGDYTILVTGKAVPMGPQAYFVLHSVVETPLFMAYPVGGELFEPLDTLRVFWDAYGDLGPFTLDVSYDNGASWSNLTTTVLKSYIWPIPNINTSKGLMRITSSGVSAQSLANFNIMERPQNLVVDSICVSQIFISWDLVSGATGYDVYLLGEKYMDLVASTTDTSVILPTTNPFEDFWYSVSAKGVDGLRSERAYAKYNAGGIQSCILNRDLSILNLGEITGEDINFCEVHKLPITATIKNNGVQPMSNIFIKYRTNGETPIVVAYQGIIDAGETVIWTAADSLSISEIGTYSLSVLLISDTDEIAVNDSMMFSFEVKGILNNAQSTLQEDFEGVEFPPVHWAIEGDILNYIWKNASVIGIGGGQTSVAMVDNYNFELIDKGVSLVSVPVNILGEKSMRLTFDYSYSPYDFNYGDSLKVVVTSLCGTESQENVVFFKGGYDLRTVNYYSSEEWVPTQGADWKHESIDIPTNDGVLDVKFININGYGNLLYLDNIRLVEGILGEPSACMGGLVALSTDIQDVGQSFYWDFDNGQFANTVGPHQVTYSTAGTKNVKLLVTENGVVDTFVYVQNVDPEPVAAFSSEVAGQTVTFVNESDDAVLYLWDFGDGQTSTLKDPTHVFVNPMESYEVCLIATNICGQSDTTCVEIQITDIALVSHVFAGIQLAPNPTSDLFYVINLGQTNYDFDFSLLDVTGKTVLEEANINLGSGEKKMIDVTIIPSGVYWVRLVSEEHVGLAKLVIE